ncbi:MAG: transcriptional regulator [Desulfobulbus propionicus]|nr:MAG: transcriptional regulator [Desulfobulbus propionicus]
MLMLRANLNDLQKMVRLISQLLKIDVAVFNRNCKIIACTEDYRKLKGKTVHGPSIEEVITQKKVVVYKPGHMESCIGCRFNLNCPATIEILRAMEIDGTPFGAITFTSFTREGHEKITSDIEFYKNTLKSFTEWLVAVIRSREQKKLLDVTKNVLQSTLDLSRASIFTVDIEGKVIHCNKSALDLFSFCNLYTCSLYHLLPKPIVHDILGGKIIKNFKLQTDNLKVLISSRPIIENGQLQGVVLYLRDTNSSLPAPKLKLKRVTASLADFKGISNEIVNIRKMCKRIANSPSTILIQGETGTGKSMLAKLIHTTSNRANHPFIVVNCSSIPETLFESEIFGYEEGAFTGAKKGGKLGRIEQADGGTLFLDEIAEMPLRLQAKLLSVLQENVIERVGGLVQIPVNVRYIAATNQDLTRLIEQKKFRSDLFYRLNIIPIKISPLRNRKEDLLDLIDEFLRNCSVRLGKKRPSVSSAFIEVLLEYSWPGNARELQNIIEYCVNMEEAQLLSPASLPEHFLQPVASSSLPGSTNRYGKREAIETAENYRLLSIVNQCGWHVSGKENAARMMGISLRTLYRRLKEIDSTFVEQMKERIP